MKSTKLAFVFVGATFLATAAPSLAIVSPNPTNAALRQQAREERGELRGTIAQERKSFWTEAKKKVVGNIYNRAKAKLQKRYDWLTTTAKNKIMARIEAKEKAKMVDLTALKTKLNSISDFADDFTAKMADLDKAYQELLALDQPLASIQKLFDARKAVTEVNTQIRQVEVEVLRQFWKM